MNFETLLKTNYGMVGRIGSIEDVDGVTYYTVYFDDGAVKRFTADDLEIV